MFDASPVTGAKDATARRPLRPVRDRRRNERLAAEGRRRREELTFKEALDLLAARAAAGPPKKEGEEENGKAAKAAGRQEIGHQTQNDQKGGREIVEEKGVNRNFIGLKNYQAGQSDAVAKFARIRRRQVFSVSSAPPWLNFLTISA